MPKTNWKALARRRAQFTGENHVDALAAIRAVPATSQWIPSASRDQALLELEFFGLIGRSGTTARAGWRPGEDPFGIRWVTPHRDRLDIGVRLRYLPSILRAVLPLYSDGDAEPYGMCGARIRLGRGWIEIHRIGLPGAIRFRRLTRTEWWQGLNTMLAELAADGVRVEAAIWRRWADRLHPEEEAHARRYAPGYSPPSQGMCEDLAGLASDFLRHHLILRNGKPITGIDLWMHNSIELEWFDGPTHAELIAALTDKQLGMDAALDERPCTNCSKETCEYSVQLRGRSGALLSLRRGRSRGGFALRDDYNGRWRTKRLATLAEYKNARGIDGSITGS